MRPPPIEEMLDTSRDKLGIPPDPVTDCAVALVAVVHATRDRNQWGGLTYWDQLAARLLLATYRADTLPGWWEQLARSMGCAHPTRAEDRDLLARCLAHPDPAAVLDLLATTTEALALRVRLAHEHHYGPKAANTATEPAQEALL